MEGLGGKMCACILFVLLVTMAASKAQEEAQTGFETSFFVDSSSGEKEEKGVEFQVGMSLYRVREKPRLRIPACKLDRSC